MNRNPIFQLALVNLKSAYREPSTLFWVFVFPLLLTLALGIAFREKAPEPIVAAIVASPGAEKLMNALEQDPQLKVFLLSNQEAYRKLRQGQVTLVVVPGNPRVYSFDPTNPESRLARSVVDDILQRSEGRQDIAPTINSFLTESGSRYIDLLLPGLIGLNIMSAGLWGIGYSIVETRTRKLLKRLVATPMRKSHFLLSAIIVRILFLCLELPVLLIFGWLVFDIAVKGSLVLFIGMAFLGAFCFRGNWHFGSFSRGKHSYYNRHNQCNINAYVHSFGSIFFLFPVP